VKGPDGARWARLAVVAALIAVLGAFTLPGTARAAAAGDRGASVLAVAETRAGSWYSYGAAGPSAFDCSGLVYWSARQLGIGMPRDTFEMLAAGVAGGVLVPTGHPSAGDLAFYGPGHVELVAHGHDVTFGALQPGTRVGFHHWSGWWHPTEYFEVR
jgi:cell wall-associated NlpC family hydrolase